MILSYRKEHGVMYNILKQLREEANLTQETVADQLGVSINTVQNWERTGKITKESLHDLLPSSVCQHIKAELLLSIVKILCKY